jgi:hypothetical protein
VGEAPNDGLFCLRRPHRFLPKSARKYAARILRDDGRLRFELERTVAKRLLFFFSFPAILASCLALPATRSQAATVKAYLFPLTGEVRLFNPDPVNALPLVFYEIFYDNVPGKPTGGLNGADGVWKSIADTYDASGNGFIDSVNQWTELGTNNSKHLAEGLFVGSTSALPPLRTISLGKIWNPSPGGGAPTILPADLTVNVKMTSSVDATVLKEVALDGDYFPDNKVDIQDYNTWTNFLGQPYTGLGDGNINGIVDAGDYTIWRDNLGASLIGTPFLAAGSGGGGLSAAAAPEPASGVLACFGGALLWWIRQARQSRRAV